MPSCNVCGAVSQGDQVKYATPWEIGGNLGPWRVLLNIFNGSRAYRGECTQGNHSEFSHRGALAHAYDFKLPLGTPILAARAGVVVDYASQFSKGGENEIHRHKANFVVIRHSDNTYARYFHMSKGSIPVRISDTVQAGDIIGRCGCTGFTTGPHLHFDVVDCYGKETSTLFVQRNTTEAIHFPSTFATFSFQLDRKDVISGKLTAALPYRVHEKVLNPEDCNNAVVLCERGGNASFLEKAKVLQNIGAKAVIIANNDPAFEEVLPLVGENVCESLSIPIVFVSCNSGRELRKLCGSTCSIGVSANFTRCERVKDSTFSTPITQPVEFETLTV